MSMHFPTDSKAMDKNYFLSKLLKVDHLKLEREIFATEVFYKKLPVESKVHTLSIDEYNRGLFNFPLHKADKSFIRF